MAALLTLQTMAPGTSAQGKPVGSGTNPLGNGATTPAPKPAPTASKPDTTSSSDDQRTTEATKLKTGTNILQKVARGLAGLCAGTPPSSAVATNLNRELASARHGADKRLRAHRAKRPARAERAEHDAKEKELEEQKKALDEWSTLANATAGSEAEKRREALEQLCSALGPSGRLIDVTAFARRDLAASAVAADPESVRNILQAVERAVRPLEKALPATIVRDDTTWLRDLIDGAQSKQVSATALDLTATAATLIQTALVGLAELIAERARFEAIGWFLEQVGENVCGQTEKVGREMRRHFMPALCALAKNDQLWAFGAGSALWSSLKVAVAADFRGLPGAAMGTVALLLLEEPKDLMGCDPATPTCKAANTLRIATAARASELLQGQDPAQVLDDWAQNLLAVPSAGSIRKPSLPAVACAASLPLSIRRWWPILSEVGVQSLGSTVGLTAMASATGCNDVRERGWDRGCLLSLAADGDCDGPDKKTRKPTSERLSHILANENIHSKAGGLESSIARFQRALEGLKKKPSPAPNANAGPSTTLEIDASTNPENVSAVMKALKGADTSGDHGAKVDAAFAVVDATFDLATQVAVLVSTDEGERARELLSRVHHSVRMARPAAKGDWAALAREVTVLLQRISDEKWFGDEPPPALTHLMGVSKEIATLVAIASTKDGEEMAKALDALADPPGGWRSKGQAGRTTISIASHAGIYAAAEWRYGAYGARLERGEPFRGPFYGQPPTLTLPLGLEIAHGLPWDGSLRVFFPLIDPIAFLGYDASRGGKLPGPSVLTVLSPGVELGGSLGDSPFNLGAFLVFRPSYRQERADADGGGAHALQLGLNLSVDVTLWSLMSKDITATSTPAEGDETKEVQ